MNDFSGRVAFIWSIADLLRGDYRQSEYGKVILPLTVLRRLDCVLEPTKEQVSSALAENAQLPERGLDRLLRRVSGEAYYNTSPLTFTRLLDDSQNVAANLRTYIDSFSPGAAEVMARFAFDEQITRLDNAGLLYLVVSRFADIDLHPDVVSNMEMGYIFEELIRRFSEQSNETAGEHFTPREVIRLKVALLLGADDEALRVPGTARTLYDPACGTGGMLSVAEEYLRELNPDARLHVFGQELNDESYAICRSDMMLKGQDPSRIAVGNTLSRDAFADERFDYMISNPPFGVEWKKIEQIIRDEAEQLGDRGRFGAGLPRINDGSLLFLQHMISKMKPAADGGSRISIVFSGSPLFVGSAGSAESEIRRWIIENDWLEAVVALPDQLFYNTSIGTYIWIVSNAKRPDRRGRVQLIDARTFWAKMERGLGEKRKFITSDLIDEIVRLYGDFRESERSRILDNDDFGFVRVTVERPLRRRFVVSAELVAKLIADHVDATEVDAAVALNELVGKSFEALDEMFESFRGVTPNLVVSAAQRSRLGQLAAIRDPDAPPARGPKGRAIPDPELRDAENVPLKDDVDHYFEREIKPYAPDAWLERSKDRVGYEIPFTRLFFSYEQPRSLSEIDEELREVEARILERLTRVTG
jgi:type I restriction enzyme M protein